jgi:hypothetical protein
MIVVHRTTMQTLDIAEISLPSYPTTEWLHDPDFEPVLGLVPRYWKCGPTGLLGMTADECRAVDARLLADTRARRLEQLHGQAFEHQCRYLDANGYARAQVLAQSGNQAAGAAVAWCRDLWCRYYAARELVMAATTCEAIEAVALELDPSWVPSAPASVFLDL